MKLISLSLVVALSVALSSVAQAQTGTLTGRFVFSGTAPTPKALDINKDAEVCGKDKPVDESVVVGKENALQNVVIFLRPKAGEALKVDADTLAAAKKATAKLDNKGCRFEPHVIGVVTDQTLMLTNSDPVGHNSKLEPFTNPGINPLIPAGGSVEHKFKDQENLPVKVTCSIHPWMTGFIVVRKDPYFAVSGADGKFEIKGLPTGEFDFVLWQEKNGYLTSVEVGGKKVTLEKGKLKQKIAAGANDLGDIKVELK